MLSADIAVAVLAAGRSTRFGSDKLMVSMDGVPLGTTVAKRIAQMGFGWRFAICSENAPLVPYFTDMGFDVVANDLPEAGQAHSLHLAVQAAQQTAAKALLVTLADMPFVTRPHLAAVAAGQELTASSFGHAPMPPALFPRSVWPMLLATDGDAGARLLLRDAHLVTAPYDELRDIDVAADLPRPQVQ
jgi:molybdenum cofactor cytidylyltransferase